ncbi:MAG: TetR/AcrR family transcriptional regulator, partial [Clostridiales bacterium]|nr:TetR/AcrR family transcriptional regulator [Clostridiales bacterium]
MANFTKKAIRDSFVKLLNEKPISQITVKDIVEDCGVNRNTFYYYYQDLPQLMENIVNEDAERIIREHPTIDSLDDCINAALEFALANREAVLHIYHSVNRDIYEQYQWRVCTYA